MIQTDLRGKVNNMPDFKNEALMPLFEAISNSIHAIEATGDLNKGIISVKIARENPKNLLNKTPNTPGEIIGFEICDNGVGLDDKNYESYQTSDSTYKLEIGGKGIGRFTWLKAFNNASISSVYRKDDTNYKRVLNFSITKGIEPISHDTCPDEPGTVVTLVNFKKEYQRETSAYKTTGKIAQRILEHCLSYYIANCAPNITVYDEQLDAGHINLSEEFKEIKERITTETLEIKEQQFILNHVKLTKTHAKMHNIVLCANNRTVKHISIASKLGTSTQFDDDGGRFIYALYISSSYLDKAVDAMRQSFSIPEKEGELTYDTFTVSLEEIEKMATEKAKVYLAEYLEIMKKLKQELIAKHVSQVDPTLRGIPIICPEVVDEIEPNSSSDKISEVLYKFKGLAENKLKKETKRIIDKQPQHDGDIEQIRNDCVRLTDSFNTVQKDSLASYVMYRKNIIDLLDKQLKLKEDGKYQKEEVIHSIIFPRYETTDSLTYEDHNLWLIDERLTFHTFAASEFPPPPQKRTDIFIYSEIDMRDRIARDVSIIEFKRPQREDDQGLEQIYKYIDLVEEGEIKPNGRPLKTNESTHYYCYLICDINEKIEKIIKRDGGFSVMKNQFGYYKFNSELRAHIEIIAFDKLISDVTQRHKIFFSKLGLPDINNL